MSPTGTDAESFVLTGQTVYRKNGALRLADGTLAGADLTMIQAVNYVHRTIGLPLEETLRMASLYPRRRWVWPASGAPSSPDCGRTSCISATTSR